MESNLINTIPEGKTKVYHASQNDMNREITCSLHDGPAATTLTGSEILKLRYMKPDGTIGSTSVTNTGDEDVVIALPGDLTAAAGAVYCKLRVDGIGAKAFFVAVEGET